MIAVILLMLLLPLTSYAQDICSLSIEHIRPINCPDYFLDAKILNVTGQTLFSYVGQPDGTSVFTKISPGVFAGFYQNNNCEWIPTLGSPIGIYYHVEGRHSGLDFNDWYDLVADDEFPNKVDLVVPEDYQFGIIRRVFGYWDDVEKKCIESREKKNCQAIIIIYGGH